MPRSIGGAALSAGAALTRARGASPLEGFLLLGRQDLIELGLGLFFEFGNLFLLIFREAHLLDRERRDQMEPSNGTTWAARTPTARTARGTVLCGRLHGKGGNRDDAENHNECWKTLPRYTP